MSVSPTAGDRRSTREFLEVSDGLLARGDAVRFRAEGWSMYPAIRDGETVEVLPVRPSDIRRGQVLLCRVGSRSVAHRVVRIDKAAGTAGTASTIVLRGDAAFANDTPIEPSEVLGVVGCVTRDGVERRLDTATARVLGALTARAWRAKRLLRTLGVRS